MTCSTDKPKPLGTYPHSWHQAVFDFPRAFIIPVSGKPEANAVRRRWRTFVKALQLEPEHPTAQRAKGFFMWTVHREAPDRVCILADKQTDHHRKPPSTAGGIPLAEYISKELTKKD